MATKAEIVSQLTDPGIIAIIRANHAVPFIPLTEALLSGGVNAVEITMSTPGAIDAIREASAKLGKRALIGVGTVLDAVTCRAAIEAGAQFVVSPICRAEIAEAANKLQKPVMLGAYTPTEAQMAHEVGSDFIKIFPADTLGPNYVIALLAPLPHLKIVPTGGVNAKTVSDFFKAGCQAVGVGSALVSKDIIEKRDWSKLTRRAAELVKVANVARSQ